jgi:hypothetical protein
MVERMMRILFSILIFFSVAACQFLDRTPPDISAPSPDSVDSSGVSSVWRIGVRME